MTDRKTEIEKVLQEYQETMSKTLEVFSKDNYGQALTQWNFSALRQVLEGSLTELRHKIGILLTEAKKEI